MCPSIRITLENCRNTVLQGFLFQEYTPERKFYTNENQDSGYDLRFAGEIDHSFCNSLDAGEYLSTALYNGGYYGRWPDCRCGGPCCTGCGWLSAVGCHRNIHWSHSGIFHSACAVLWCKGFRKSAKISGTQLSADRIHRSGSIHSQPVLCCTGINRAAYTFQYYRNVIIISAYYFLRNSGYCSL